jgi:hypothetical protein
MNPERRRLALRASVAALRVRQKGQIDADDPCSVFDLADKLGVEVRFAALPSAEGVYSPGKPVIVVSSLRPPGRQSFTCAHELAFAAGSGFRLSFGAACTFGVSDGTSANRPGCAGSGFVAAASGTFLPFSTLRT